MKVVRYKVKQGSEAHKAIKDFIFRKNNYEEALSDAVEALGGDRENYLLYRNGSLAGIRLDYKPDGWKSTLGHPNYYLPYAKNKKAWAIVPETQDFSSTVLSELLFNKVPYSFTDTGIHIGCSLGEIEGNFYVHHCQDNVKPILKGMIPISNKTYIGHVLKEHI